VKFTAKIFISSFKTNNPFLKTLYNRLKDDYILISSLAASLYVININHINFEMYIKIVAKTQLMLGYFSSNNKHSDED
jgi:hypothetical protein